jgi:hypothetical protein
MEKVILTAINKKMISRVEHKFSGLHKIVYFAFLVLLLIFLREDFAVAQRTKTSLRAGEERKAEKGLKDNRYFIYFLDPSITNFGSDTEKNLFKEACRRDIISQILFMKYLFRESFAEIRKAQEILIKLYQLTLRKDIDAARDILNGTAPKIILAEDAKGAAYLKLGYREHKTAEIFLTMADNCRDTLYSLRLYQYVKAIKNAKHGKRYALLALVESQTPQAEKKEEAHIGFSELNDRIIKSAPADKQEYYSLVHLDNYYKIKDKTSIYEAVWENPELNKVDDYKRYLIEAE